MPKPVRSFQHYEVLRQPDGAPWELGRGAMGVTYKAFDVNLCCEVALKVVSSALVENSEARERFVREARAAAALRHRNVASVYHLGNDGEHFFYAMEFINGETLDALVRREGPLSVANTLRVVLQVARALAAAERQGLVHRDIKPANLMVTHEDGDEETVVKVIDFGLARQAAGSDNAAPLTIGGFVGTPQYASPEQLEERPLDARSDLYSLGITAWFLLTGRVPFTGSLATICQLQLTQPPPWEQLSPEVPTCVRGLLGHLLAKDPARRPQSAAELRAEIEACLDKVQGTDRRRDLHLPAASLLQEGRDDTRSKAAGRTPGPGTVLNSRYRLLREIGGRNGVRVFQARDEAEFEKPVAVKILPETNAAGREAWQEEVRLVRAAAHPNLVQVLALEQSGSPKTTFLVEEWLTGCTLRDLLVGRGGALPVAETLQVLAQAAEAADQAARCRLEALDLALPDMHLNFAVPTATDEAAARLRILLAERLTDWPDWTLKIHAFKPVHDALDLATWAGGVTLVPGARPDELPPADAGGRYVQALAALVYELLGGAMVSSHYVSLAVLNEEANAVLRQALGSSGEMVSGRQLHESLAKAVGEEPARGNGHLRMAVAEPLPALVTRKEVAAKPESNFGGHDSTISAGGESVAALFHDHDGPEPSHPDDEVAGSAWDRLALVTEKRAHPARWVAGIVGLGAVFVLGFIAVFAWLWQQSPAHTALVSPPVKKRTAMVSASPANRPVSRSAIPTPLPVRPADSTPAGAAAAARENRPSLVEIVPTPSPSPSAVERVENLPPTPVPVEAAATPAPTPVRERFTMVRLDSVPEGAQIRLGSEVLGTTPCRVRLLPGEHQLIARYQNWPETRQTVHVDATEVRAAVEIRLMRPDLVPGSAAQPSLVPEGRVRRIFAPAAHRSPPVEEATPVIRPTVPVVAATPTPGVSEPEVRPAGRVLTPFQIDEPTRTVPRDQPSPSIDRQPFSTDDADGD